MERMILGLLYIAIVAAALVFIGALGRLIVKWFGYSLDGTVEKFYMLVVLLVVLYMLVALFLGLPYAFMRPL